MGIGGISMWKLMIIFLVVLILFGSKRLKGLGSDLGEAIRSLRNTIGNDDTSHNSSDRNTSEKVKEIES